ncbi:MAG: magnesium transporter CorA family protein, partial [Gammaproteobacteria bacterium]|nr:magnesium transporter CorA family protein [Gammaproteobacteria bacterium]
LQARCDVQLVDLHVSDLLNDHLPSRYDYTSQYDVLVFRRLAATGGLVMAPESGPHAAADSAPAVLRSVDTRPVGFAVFDRMLLSVHPEDISMRDMFAKKLLAASPGDDRNGHGAASSDSRSGAPRAPSSPAELMLRLVSQIVDGYLELRRDLTRQLDHWQADLLDPKSRFRNWNSLMEARQSMRHLGEICEDQQGAVQDWIDAYETLPTPSDPVELRDRELTMVRSRDVLEHIERVVRHVQRLEQNAETAVQMHFSVQSHRTNDIMRVLTVLTAVFLPLNLIAGIFGMNFEFIPLVHKADGFWIAMGSMGVTALVLVLFFWRKRYLARSR